MAEFVERKSLIAWLHNMAVSPALIAAIENKERFPAADVVEVVRCKNCKHLEVINDGKVYAKCKMTEFEFLPFGTDTRTHYCGFGERRSE